MRRLALATYAINGAQISNMLLTAFVVPLLIGAADYGLYAAIFALPAFFQSAIEAYAVLNLTRGGSGRRFWTSYVALGVLAATMSCVIYVWFFDPHAAVWSAALGIALLFRGAGSALVYTNQRVSFVRANVIAEVITFCIYASVLAPAIFFAAPPHTVPLLMIISASVVAGTYLLWANFSRRDAKTSAPATSQDSGGFRFLWARSYEDLSLTLMPLFVANAFGMTAAGEFRVIVSGMKVLSKLFPFRYEVILRGIRAGEFSAVGFLKVSTVFAVFGLLVALALYFMRGFLFLTPDTQMWIIALSTGALVANLAAFPVATLYSSRPALVSGISALATLCALWSGQLQLFLGLFIAMNVVTFASAMLVLVGQERTGGFAASDR